MDPATIAIAVTTALGTALVNSGISFAGKALDKIAEGLGEKVGEKAGDMVTSLMSKAQKKNDTMTPMVLQQFSGDPKNVSLQQMARISIQELIKDDEELMRQLEALAREIVGETKSKGGNVVTVGTISGNEGSNITVAGGDVTQGDLSFGTPRKKDK